jgi:redox-sensitive bicupin YhaK (pirin superfamily)
MHLIAGHGFGLSSPVHVLSPTLYAHAMLERAAYLTIDAEHEERALYVVEGSLLCDQRRYGEGSLLVLRPGVSARVEAPEASRLMLLGGQKLAGERFIEWNFVSSHRSRIEQAKAQWKAGEFAGVPGDSEFIPLPG